ncbi:hypothetical protein [Okeania sp. SIO1I7]|uniref:hypothetical protein n=1 Tax=Okeania sp. SIO1I7 TaxID=2607772 RepID=UPI0013FC07EE|nr:hypothetical protein [Okeania sp. SIO1I7]NET28084.1 hypothetical protein [Okeania sp. SIO1I7]
MLGSSQETQPTSTTVRLPDGRYQVYQESLLLPGGHQVLLGEVAKPLSGLS